MKTMRFALAMCLLLALAGVSMAQMSDDTSQGMQSMRATIQAGPVVRAGLPPSADVFVNDKFALRIPASAAGMSPMQRARVVADRLNNAFAAGATWQDMSVEQVGNYWVVMINDAPIITADARSASAMRMSPQRLASSWARQTVVALGGQPQTIASRLEGVEERVAGAREEIGAMAWTTTRTKAVPLLDATGGSRMGTVTVAGSQTSLNGVNAVVVYQSDTGQARVWTFVPVTQTAMATRYTRVPNVGLVGVPTNLMPTTGYMMGGNIPQMITDMDEQWNTTINTSLTQSNLGIGTGTTSIVPLYSMDDRQIVGAVQVIGRATDVARAEAVIATRQGNVLRFQASTDQPPYTATARPATMNNVLVQSIILFPEGGMQPGTIGGADSSAGCEVNQ